MAFNLKSSFTFDQKGELKWVNAIPLSYWYQRYAWKSVGPLFLRILLQDVYPLFVSLLILDWDFKIFGILLSFYILTRPSFLAAYEFGYFVNDFWSSRREKNSLTSYNTIDIRILAASVTARVIFIFICILLLGNLGSALKTNFVFLLLITQVIFLFHNIFLLPIRTITFGLLQLTHYSLPLCYFLTQGWSLAATHYAILATPVSLMWALLYTVKKGVIENSFLAPQFGWFFPGIDVYVIRASIPALVITTFIFGWKLGSEMFFLAFGAITFLLIVSSLLDIARFFKRVKEAVKNQQTLYHVHTQLSHDANISLGEISETVRRANINLVYIAEHAEDLDIKSYFYLKNMCEKHSDSLIKIFPGLEYEVLGQHFLCIGLADYITVDSLDVCEIKRLKNTCNFIVWAHPFFSIRKLLTSKSYRKDMKAMATSVDAMEVFNFKALTRSWIIWRQLLLCFWGVAFGGRLLVIGADFHSKEDLNLITTCYPDNLFDSFLSLNFFQRLILKLFRWI